VLLLSSALVWLSSGSAADDRLSVTFLDVGQGEAILIESASGNRMLIDGGPSGEAITAALGRSLPFYDRRIDLIVVTHPQADHIGGLPAVLERYEVNAIMQSPAAGDSLAYQSWAEAIARSGATVIDARRGQEIDIGAGAEITILGPLSGAIHGAGGVNDSSTVLLLSYGSTRILLTADISGNGEAALVASGTDMRADVLKVAHHGSATSTSGSFLARVHPGVAVVSAGRDNRFGHPDPETLTRLDQAEVFRTDQDGDVRVLTDGQNVWVKTSR
jgi:competence protein ComEC